MGLARGTASLLAIIGLTMGARLILYPRAFRDTFFGRALSKSVAGTLNESAKRRREAEEDANPWIVLLGGRNRLGP